MLKKSLLISFILIYACIILLVGCGDNTAESDKGASTPEENHNSKQLKVYTSIYVLYDFAKEIGGNAVEVHNMMPAGVDAHDFEPSPKDMVALADADLFVYNGSGFEAWAEKAVETLDDDKTRVVSTSERLDLMTNEESGHVHKDDDHEHGLGYDHDHGNGDDHSDEHDHHHDHGQFDPHVWLDPNLAKEQAESIKDALVEIDPDNAETYETNFRQLVERFNALDEKFRDVSERAKRKELIVSHAAFGYLTKRYGLEQVAVSGLSPSDEPSQKELTSIIQFAKANDVKYILFETLVSSKVADVVRKEVGAEALTFHPLENLTKAESENGEDYFSIMDQNVKNLAIALEAGGE